MNIAVSIGNTFGWFNHESEILLELKHKINFS